MSEQQKNTLDDLVSRQTIEQIDACINQYPTDNRQSAVMRALMLVQEEKNHLTEALMDAVADYLNMPPIAVYEVATFYTMYEHEKVGENVIHVCHSISCHLRGSDKILENLENHLGIQCGQTTPDGKFSLRKAECLGACVNAPMMQVNKNYHENLDNQKLTEILETYK